MGNPIEAAVERVLLGDFQGNGRASVLGLGAANAAGAAYARLFFVQEDGSAEESSLLGFPVASPQLRDLNADGRDDFVFSLLSGLGVMLGQVSEELVPVSYPLLTLTEGASTLAIPIQPNPLSPLNQGIVIFVGFDDRGALESLEDDETIAKLPFPLEKLAGEPVVADIVQDSSAPCGEMIFAYEDEPEVWLVQPCNADGTWASPDDNPLRLAATLPDGYVVDTGPFVGDIDADGTLDLVVGAKGGDSFVALGCGAGRFCADPTDTDTAGEMLLAEPTVASTCAIQGEVEKTHPIAMGDINADGVSDFVTPFTVVLTRGVELTGQVAKIEICTIATKLVGQWSSAKIEDLNLDGHADVIAGSSSSLDLEFFAGTGLDRMNLTRITTQAPVSHMSLGDFDGDLVPDLAVGLSSPNEDTLAISYGRLQQPPEPLVTVGAFDGMDQVVAAYFDEGDAVQELGVVARNSDGMQTVTVFLSSGGRQLLAPFGLIGAPAGPTPEADLEGSPLSLAVDDFDGDGHPDLASLALDGTSCGSDDCPFRLWVTPSEGEADLLPSLHGPQLPSDILLLASSDVFGLEVVAFPVSVDIDGDACADVVLIAPFRADRTQSGVWWAKLDSEAGELTDVQLVTQGPLLLTARSFPVVEDLDEDGAPDVVALAGGELVVAWGTSGLDLSQPVALDVPEEPLGFAFVHADTDGLREMVVVGEEKAYLAQRSPSEPRVWTLHALDGVDGGTSVAVRDIDGDGIEDLAIADELGVRTYRGKAVLP